MLRPDDFYRDAHKTLYQSMLTLYVQREPADFVTLCNELERTGRLADVGGTSVIASLMNAVPTSANAVYYARIVAQKALYRRLIHAAGQIAALAYEETDDALEEAEQLIFALGQAQGEASDLTPVQEVLSDCLTTLDALHERRTSIIGVPTGYRHLDAPLGGLQRSDLVILAARPGTGKCLTAHTLIDLPGTGERKTLEACIKQREPLVYGLSEDGVIRPALVSHWIDSGIQPCYRVRTRLGREVEVTGHHPFLTVHGWKPLHDVHVGHHIAVPAKVACFGEDEHWPLEKVRLLAYLLADAQPRNATTMQGGAILPKNPVTVWLQELGLMGKSAKEKSFPPCVWKWSRQYLAEFLKTLMSCDGSIFPNSKGQPTIQFTVTSPQLAKDVSHAFLRFGIVGKYYSTSRGAYRIDVTANEGVRTYQQEIGWIGEKHSRYRLAAYAQVLDDNNLRRASSPDVYWDEIVAIEPIGEQQVYDVTVPDGANFIANDVFVHNTSFALGVAHNACQQGYRVALFSLEMSRHQLVMRLLSTEAGIDQHRLRLGRVEDHEWEHIVAAMGTLSEERLWIDDTAGLSLSSLRSRARRLQSQYGVDLVIVDYLQLVRASLDGKRFQNREQEIAEISRGLKAIAKELDVPVLALAQLSRAVEIRASKVPQLSDLRESGCLTGDTPVYLPDEGVYLPIKECVGQSGFRVLALNTETWKLEARAVTRAFATGCKQTYKMTTRLGRTIRATGNHTFFTFEGWERLDQLCSGQRIALPRRLPGPACKSMTDAEIGLLGHLIGDGCTLQRSGIQYVSGDLGSAEMVVNLAAWLDGLAFCSRVLASHLEYLERRRENTNRDVIPNQIWRQMVVPAMRISAITTRQMQAALGNVYCGTGLYKQNVSRERATRLANIVQSEPLAALAQSDVYWDEIVSIVPDEETDVYDLTVEGLHNFVAGDMIVHNSIENESDVVLFIYRDDLYNPESEAAGTADLIIAKHRNGPTGTIRLGFDPTQTRFYTLEAAKAD